MVTVESELPTSRHQDLSKSIAVMMKTIESITPRTKKQIAAALKNNDMALAFDDTKLVGWLIATPYSDHVQEIGMAYIIPKYRRQRITHQLIQQLINRRTITLVVTYTPHLEKMLVDTWHFRTSSLREFSRLTKTRFILGRLGSVSSVIAVARHLRSQSPYYLVRINRDEQ